MLKAGSLLNYFKIGRLQEFIITVGLCAYDTQFHQTLNEPFGGMAINGYFMEIHASFVTVHYPLS
jgi:hypothetical protein